MAELDDLEKELTALRRELSAMSCEGCTPTQFLKLQRELVRAWAAVEDCKAGRLPSRPSALAGEAKAGAQDAAAQQDVGRSRG